MNTSGVDPRNLAPLIGVAGASVLLFYSGFFAFLFAVPIQAIYTRRGAHSGITASVITAGLIVVIHLLQIARLGNGGTEFVRVLLLDSLMPIGLIVGIGIFNIYRAYPWWLRLTVSTGVAFLGSIPSMVLLHQAVAGEGELGAQLTQLLAMLGITENPRQWIEMVRSVVFRTIALGLMVAIAANWWIGRNLALRTADAAVVLRQARVPEETIWVVIAGLAVVVGGWIATLPAWFVAIGWNAMLLSSFLFAVQGIGLGQHLLHRRGFGPRSERWVLTLVLIMMFLPGLNVVASVGLPLFGMSELWIDYKRGEPYESDTEQ